MIRTTEPMVCPVCRAPVVPGEALWFDLLDDYTAGPVHVCQVQQFDGDAAS